MDRQGAEKDGFVEPNGALDDAARAVVGAAIEVHRILGPGLLESVYEEALSVELALRSIPFDRQVPFTVIYKGVEVGVGRLDFLVADCLVVELKARPDLRPIHLAQVLFYLKATGHSLGLLINFDVPRLRDGLRRIIRTH